MKTVQDIMTKNVIYVDPDLSIVEAVNILFKHSFNGLPVVNKNKDLVGIVTEYDLIINGSSVYLPTFIKVFSEIDLYKKDEGLISDDLKKILNTKVKEIMNSDPLTVNNDATLEEVAKTFGEHHKVNPIPVLDADKKLVGIVSRSDMIKFFNAPSIKGLDLGDGIGQREIDKNVNLFLKDLNGQFVLVSKFRTRFWLIISILFAIVGYIIAWATILRFV